MSMSMYIDGLKEVLVKSIGKQEKIEITHPGSTETKSKTILHIVLIKHGRHEMRLRSGPDEIRR